MVAHEYGGCLKRHRPVTRQVRALLLLVWEPVSVDVWMLRHSRVLNGDSPIRAIRRGNGQDVLDVVLKILAEYGVAPPAALPAEELDS